MPPLADVSGTVTLAGKPLANAIVEYRPTATGRPSVATTNSDGYYSLLYTADYSGAVIGDHSIQVTLADAEDDYSGGDEESTGGLPLSAFDGSLTFKVEDGNNTNDIAL